MQPIQQGRRDASTKSTPWSASAAAPAYAASSDPSVCRSAYVSKVTNRADPSSVMARQWWAPKPTGR